MRITIHNTFAYEVEAHSKEEALELWEQYWDADNKDDRMATGVVFEDNELDLYDAETGDEL